MNRISTLPSIQSIEPFGDQALLISTDQPASLAFALENANIHSISEIVPAINTVLVIIDHHQCSIRSIQKTLEHLHVDLSAQNTQKIITIPVRYDGCDLADVASRCALSVQQVIEIHSQAQYIVSMIGFLPGFPYLDGLPSVLHLPRRDQPRARVDAGSIAIAGRQTGIYPQDSPGGWHIMGHTDVTLFDPERDPPTLLHAGDLVQFEPI